MICEMVCYLTINGIFYLINYDIESVGPIFLSWYFQINDFLFSSVMRDSVGDPDVASSPRLAIAGSASLDGALECYTGFRTLDQTQRFQMKSISNKNSLAIPKFMWFHYFQAFLIKLE